MPQLTGVLETSLYVRDLAQAKKFYERIFGLRPMAGDDRFCAFPVAGKQVLLLFLQGGTTEPVPLAGGEIPPHDGSGQYHMAFSCSAEELSKWEASFVPANDVPIESRVSWERGGTSIYFRDSDQNLLEIVTPGIWPIY